MSEYQYYEFLAVDRPLTSKQREELRQLSTRAEITATRFTNEYHWGSFRGDPEKMMAACWEETAGELGAMVAARSELLGGDHRLLYLAWLTGIQWDDVDDEHTEPPVPAGLADLSGALRAIADFLEIDEDLIAVADEASPALSKEESAAGLAEWIATLPVAEKDKLLTMVADGEGPQVQALLLRRFRDSVPSQNEPARPARTAAELWTATGARKAAREESEARARRAEEERAAAAKAAAYDKRLDQLASRTEDAWQEAENLIETKKPRDYDLAVALLRDLSALAGRDGDHERHDITP